MSRHGPLHRSRRRRGASDEENRFGAFVAEAGDGLFRLAVVLSTDVRAGEDLYQETLQRLAGRWATIENPEAWSRRVMHNLAVDRFRARRARLAEVAPPDDAPGPPDPRSAEGLEAVEVRSVLFPALRDLTDTQRLVVALRFLEDRSEADVAGLLGVPVGTIKSTTSRAVDRLRRNPSIANLYPSREFPTNEAAS